jgi:multicomponent Na+:H+ antiporter subunit G
MSEFLEGTALVLGALFCLLAGVGIARLPDVYTRMQAATKAGTLGIAFLIVGVALHFDSALTALEAALVILFIFLTAPIASHLLARSAYFLGATKSRANTIDELEGRYDLRSKALHSPPPGQHGSPKGPRPDHPNDPA